MADGRGRERWEHTSSILAVLINVNRGKGDRAVKPSELNPYTARKKKDEVLMKVKMSDLKPFFDRISNGRSSGN
jgi:hypothetical protein